VGARFSALVQIGPGAHPASCTMGTGSFAGVKSDRGRGQERVELYLYSPYGPYELYRASVPVKGCNFLYLLHEDQYTFFSISRSVLLIMRNVSNKRWREIKRHILFSVTFFFENLAA